MDGVWMIIGFTEHLQFVTTRNYNVIFNSHTLQFTTAHTWVFSVSCVLTSRCVRTDPNNVLCFRVHVLSGWRLSHSCRLLTRIRSTALHWLNCQSCVTTDGQSVSRSVCRRFKHPSGAYDQIFITVRQLRVCWRGALSLTRERVYRLQLLLVLASAVILGSESCGTRNHILLSQIRDLHNLEGQAPVFISPRNSVAQL
jgi:hypothetical protein